MYNRIYIGSNTWLCGRGQNSTIIKQMFPFSGAIDAEGMLNNTNQSTGGNSFITITDLQFLNTPIVPTGIRPGITALFFRGVSDVVVDRITTYSGTLSFGPLTTYFNTSNVHTTGNNNRTKITNCYLWGGGENIAFGQGTDLIVRSNHLINSFDSSLSINSSGERIDITGNIFDKQLNNSPALGLVELTNDHAGDSNGIRDLVIANNVMLNTGNVNTSAIDIGNGITNCVISGNEIRNINCATNTSGGIYSDDNSGINSNIVIVGNTINTINQDGIFICNYKTSNNIVISNNNISNCLFSGIKLGDGGGGALLTDITINNNVITNNTLYGINIGNVGATNGYISYNTFDNNTAGNYNVTSTTWVYAQYIGAKLGLNVTSPAATVDIFSNSSGMGLQVLNSGTIGTSSPLVNMRLVNASDTGGTLNVTGNANTNSVLTVQNNGTRALATGDAIALFKSTNTTDGSGYVVKIQTTGTANALLANGNISINGIQPTGNGSTAGTLVLGVVAAQGQNNTGGTGGNGGTISLTSGAGGTSSGAVANTSGGGITINGGAAGTGGSGTAGTIGTLTLQSTGGNVLIGAATATTGTLIITPALVGNYGLYVKGSGTIGQTVDLVRLETTNASDTAYTLHIRGTVNSSTQNAAFFENNGANSLAGGNAIVQIKNSNSSDATGGILLQLTPNGSNASGMYPLIVTGGLSGFGVTAPTSTVQISGGSTTVAPLIINSGTNLATPTNGAIENNGTHLYVTLGGTRYQLDQQSGTGGTVTSVSVVSANGFAGTVATSTTTPAITLTTSITGLLKGNGTAISAATAGTDYQVPLTFSSGLTNASNTVTDNLITGLAGGQTVIGGTGTTDSLTLQSTNGVGATGALINFKVGNNGGTTAMTIINTGTVGIGTTSPGTNQLSIVTVGSNGGLNVTNNGGTGLSVPLINAQNVNASDTGGILKLTGNANTNPVLFVQNNGQRTLATGDAIATFQNVNSTDATGAVVKIATQSSSTAYALIVPTGSVGIGTSSPQQKLTLGSASNFATELILPASPAAALASGGTLTVSTPYYYVITAKDSIGETIQSTQVTATPTSGNQTISLTWTASQGAASYNVYRSTTTNTYGATSFLVNVTTNSYSDTGGTSLTSGTPPTVTTAYVNKITASGNSWHNGGNFGIGTSNPSVPLQIGTMSNSAPPNTILMISTTGAVSSSVFTNRISMNVNSDGNFGPYIGNYWINGGGDTEMVLGTRKAGVDTNTLYILTGNVGIGVTTPTAKLHITGSTTSASSLRIANGTAPTTPNDGDIWYDGTHLQFRQSSTTYQLDQQTTSVPSLIASITGISGTAAASTTVYTVPTGKTLIITQAIVRATAATSITNGPTAGFGTSTSTYNIYASTAINALTTAGLDFGFVTVGMSTTVAAAGVVYFNIGTGATGTSETLAVELIGYLK